MKIIITILCLLIFTNGCAISDDYATAFAGCIDDLEEENSRWEKNSSMEVYVRGIERFDYCARWSQKMIRKYRRMGYLDDVAVNQAVSKQEPQTALTGVGKKSLHKQSE